MFWGSWHVTTASIFYLIIVLSFQDLFFRSLFLKKPRVCLKELCCLHTHTHTFVSVRCSLIFNRQQRFLYIFLCLRRTMMHFLFFFFLLWIYSLYSDTVLRGEWNWKPSPFGPTALKAANLEQRGGKWHLCPSVWWLHSSLEPWLDPGSLESFCSLSVPPHVSSLVKNKVRVRKYKLYNIDI